MAGLLTRAPSPAVYEANTWGREGSGTWTFTGPSRSAPRWAERTEAGEDSEEEGWAS